MSSEQRLLLVEDDALIAMDLEDELSDHGHACFCASTVSQALQMLENETPYFAILDMQLKSEASFPIAMALKDKGIPFVFVSGNDESSLPDPLKSCTIVTKPVRIAAVLKEIAAAQGST